MISTFGVSVARGSGGKFRADSPHTQTPLKKRKERKKSKEKQSNQTLQSIMSGKTRL